MGNVRDNIIGGATELFLKKGCKVITMDDIAKSLGMSKRTIYENFKDKEELLACCLELLFENVDKEVDRMMYSENFILSFLEFKDSTNSILHRIPKDFFLEVKRYFPETFKKIVETRICNHEEKTILFLEKGKREGYFLKSLNNKILCLMMQEVGKALADEEVFSQRNFSSEELFLNGFIPYLRGVSTQKGIETIDKYYRLQ